MAKAERFQDKIILVLNEEEAADIYHIAYSCIARNCLPGIHSDPVLKQCSEAISNPFQWSGEACYRVEKGKHNES